MEDITKLNGQEYTYKYILYNTSGRVKISDNSVNALVISDDFLAPFEEGSITISNPFNFIEKEYVFKGDGSDRIEIELTNLETKLSIGGIYTILGEDNFIDDSTPAKNRKTLHFIDQDESKVLHEFPYGSSYCGRTSDILEKILLEAGLPVGKGFKEFKSDSCFTNFDPCVMSVNYRYNDAIYYMLRHCYRILGDYVVTKGFLKKNRKTKSYDLLRLDKVFAENNKRTKEVFHAGDIVNSGDLKFNRNNPQSPSDAKYALFQNNVTSVAFDTVNVDITNENLMNSRVVTYDPHIGRHRSTQVKLVDVESEWKNYFVNVFSSISGSVKPHFNKGGPGKKISSQWKTFRLPFSHEQNVRIVQGNMVGDLVFRNNQINLVTNGNLLRQTGDFFDVIKVKDENILADTKLVGRWFMTRVDHYKLGATYRNSLNAVKTYVGPSYPKNT